MEMHEKLVFKLWANLVGGLSSWGDMIQSLVAMGQFGFRVHGNLVWWPWADLV
jgi:prolipoprotein diacylglyceryltransferase